MSVPHRHSRLACGTFLIWVLLSCVAFSLAQNGKPNPSYTQFGHDITIGPTDEVGELTCFACSVHVRGQVAGDVTVFGGSLTLEDQAQVAGDVAVFAGDVRLTKAAKIAGDAAVFGGDMRRDQEATIGGDVTAMSGRGWVVLIFGAPLVLLGLLVTGVVWLVQRYRRPAMVPA